MTEETATNPAEADEALVEAQAGVEPEEIASETEGQAHEQPEADEEDIEHDGQKYRVPKALKPALMMQADYTRKTQELAEQRKAFEASREQSQKSDAEHIQAHAEVVSLDQAIQQWSQVDWDAYQAQDPQAAMRDWRRFQELKEARQSKASELQQKEQQRALDQQRSHAKRVEESAAVLARDIPGWNDKLVQELDAFGGQLGFTPEERFRLSADPRIVKILHQAFVATQSQKQAKTVQQITEKAAVKPVTTVRGTTARPSVNALSDRSSTSDWMKARNEQVRKGR